MKIRHIVLLIYIVSCFKAGAQQLLPFVENFTKSEYQGDNQVWSVVQGNDNAMYFANNHFFLRYNGVKWEKYTLPNKTIIRSVYSFGDKIYSGSYKEFGYWHRKNGFMVYKSLSEDAMFAGFSGNEEIWKIFSFGKNICFQSFNALYVYDGIKTKRINFPSQISYCYPIDNEVYAATTREGIFVLKNNKFIPVSGWGQLKGGIIHGIEKHNGEIYVFTKNNGVFKGDKDKLVPWQNPVNFYVKEAVILSSKFIDKTKLAIGTSRQGLYIVDLASNTYININRKNSLKNNAVLSIALDRENDLWLGLDNGISHVEVNSPVNLFTDNSGLLGSVYSLSSLSNTGYLLVTNHGIFTYKTSVLEPIPNTQGQVWDVYKNGNKFILGHNDGTLVYDGNVLKNESPVNGGWKFLKSRFDGVYFQANYAGIAVYKDINKLSEYKMLGKIEKPIRNIAQNHPGELWAADNYKSLYRITYDENLNVKKIQNVSADNNIKGDFGVKLFNFKDQILFFINNIWYTYNSLTGKLEKNTLFNSSFGNVSDIIPIDEDTFMVFKDGLLYNVNQKGNDFLWKLLPEKYYQGRLIIENIQVFAEAGKLVVNLDDGFVEIKRDIPIKKNAALKIEAFYEGKYVTPQTSIKYNHSLELDVVSPWFGYNRADLQYRFNGGRLHAVNSGKIILNNLASGSHDIELFANNGLHPLKLTTYKFTVDKPWYFSLYMIMAYVAFTVLVFYLYYKWNHFKYLQKVRLNEEELRHRTQIIELEHEAEIKLRNQEYEKHLLETEVQTKASEVAGKSLSIAKHSEMIESIQEVLESEKNVDRLVTKIKKVIKTSTISKNEWQSFEKNLIKSHEEFVARLTEKYPVLTPKDIKLCIYLKMNLSSKEIAPLMNISFRGVELHRYRLRKKLEIGTEESLSRFMINI
ncbi:histidine kinase [Flavobacterium psychrotrophum]|uniref:histidine kinase n=1 Tax=Flavobacterium psychrotrophum TaxID=2294119 RepID=UPI000E315F8E|nr:histidine kinase [Flavobacterium psychrotrophum]